MKSQLRILVLVTWMGCAFVGGCGVSKPARYYALTATATKKAIARDAPMETRASVGIVGLTVPIYLERPQVVTGGNGNRLILHDQDRWAEPLKEGCARVLAANLAAMLPEHLVRHRGWLDKSGLDFVVTVVIDRFERSDGGSVILVADWSVERKGAEQSARTLRREYVADTASPSTDALAQTMSELLSQLAADIAAEITSGGTRR